MNPRKRTAAPGTNGRGSDRGNETVSNYHIDKGKQAPSRRDPLGDESELDRPRTVTFWDDIAGTAKREKTPSLRAIADLVEDTVRASKEDLLKIKFAKFGSKRSAKRSLRHDGNLISFEAVEGDYDAGEMPIQEARDLLKKAGLAALLFETPSSTRKAPRWRVILPCSRAMQPEDRERLVARANGVLGGILAGESFSSSQFYYAGTVKGKRPEILLVDGRPIDKARELDKGAITKRKKDREAKADAETRENNETDSAAAYRKAMQLHLNGGSFEDFEEWAIDNPWTDYQVNPDRALERTWENAKGEAGRVALEQLNDDLGFEDLGKDPDAKGGKSDKRKSTLASLDLARVSEPGGALEIVEDLLPADSFTCVFGPSTSGKTFFLLDLTLHIALNKAWQGRGVMQRGVCYTSLEGAGGFRKRIAAWQKHHGIDDLSKYPFIAMTGSYDMRNDKATAEHIVAAAKELERKTGIPTGLIVIDTLARAMAGGDENTAQDMGAIIRVADRLRLATGATVCVVHHTGKDTAKGARGSNALFAAVDTEIELSRNIEIRTATVTKQKDGKEGDTFPFKLQQVELGYNNQWGKPAQSCVVTAEVIADFEDLTDVNDRAGKAIAILKKRIQRAKRLADLEGIASRLTIPQDDWREALQTADWPKVGQTKEAFRKAWARLKKDPDILKHVEFDGDAVRCK